MPADLILYNLKTLAKGAVSSVASSVIAIYDNKIGFLGSEEEQDGLRGPNTRMLDCQGGIVLPGFNDAHCHPIAHAITKRYVDCAPSSVRCIDDIQALLRQKLSESSADRWIRGVNLDTAALAEARSPTRWELDAAVPDLPVVLVDRAGQYCVLNTVAMRRCGIDDNARGTAAFGIAIDRDLRLPNGIIHGHNSHVANLIPPLADHELEAALQAADQEFLSRGITSIQDTSWSNAFRHWQAMQAFKAKRLLTPRVTMLVGIDALEEFVRHGLKTGAGDEFLRLGAIKLALDESTGTDEPSQADLNRLATDAHVAGFQLAFHVPNINLLRKSLRALDAVSSYARQRCRRPRFEHCPVCPASLLPELARSGATVVSQPNLLYQTGPAYLSEVHEERLPWIFPYRSYTNFGIGLAFSSDAPLTPCDPLRAIKTAITRIVDGGATLNRHEAVGLAQALNMYSRAGAYCSNEESIKGSLAPGQFADLVVLENDGLADLDDAIVNATVAMTLIDGKIAWSR